MDHDYKNIKVNYTINGNGPALLLLHGLLEDSTMWEPFIEVLSAHHCVICIDLLGHGKTDCLGYIHTMEAMAEAVVSVLEHQTIKKVKIIGHSMGGYVALALAEAHPALISALVLMNSTFEADSEERKLLRTQAIATAKKHYKRLVQLSFANLFAAESRTRFKEAYTDALKIALKTTRKGFIAAQEGMKERPNRLEIFEQINGKTAIVVGRKDTLIDRKGLKYAIRNTNAVWLELSEGHMSHIENKSELSYFLKHFIEN
ncbi:alpha/beta fold hydrolase [Winogradskyella aurantia]|uniref:Alpha/beta hydrolase n=1 Tax=Winogradskyella aurantia TaxID=1915063 RepID=A0A265V0F2_9FLAO|nr:alpha/beta hydrolase [Winogradskyella aurantia]OZV70962.1 alpha/beta hydrolase [Winogradskyella aurantia]